VGKEGAQQKNDCKGSGFHRRTPFDHRFYAENNAQTTQDTQELPSPAVFDGHSIHFAIESNRVDRNSV
jgi:hypothetical protein